MQQLRELMSSLSKAEQQSLAQAVGMSLGHLKNVMYGCEGKKCSAELASDIERESVRLFGQHRKVSRWDLIPDRWPRIWPELVGSPGAPPVPAIEAANDATQAQRA